MCATKCAFCCLCLKEFSLSFVCVRMTVCVCTKAER